MKKFEYFEHPADVGIFAYGKDLAEILVNAATATTEQMVKTGDIGESVVKEISYESASEEKLLLDFLDEIIFFKDSESVLFSKFDIDVKEKDGKFVVKGKLFGEKIDMNKQELGTDVKAVTMHKFKIEKVKEGYKATFILDI
ncbi:archease [Nanoarchaeota archaeon]